MPVQGVPPVYRRGTSFSRYALDRPGEPLPADRLDQELDDIAYVLQGRATELSALVGATGQLKSHIVGRDQFVPDLFDEITRTGADKLIPLLSDALAAAERAARYANDAGAFVVTVQRAADAAHAQAHIAHEARTTVESLWGDFEQVAATVDVDEQLAKNAADTAEAFMVQAEAARDMSQKWSEYLAGPVQPAPPGWPEAIDDGMWSSKWWAVRASEIVGTWGNWYLGAAVAPPVLPATGPWPPGTLYYDTDSGQMMVWDGVAWKPITAPAPAAGTRFVYVATANQAVFSGPDAMGNTPTLKSPTPQPSECYLNGVRLVEDRGGGQGDYTVDAATSSLQVKAWLAAGSVLQWNLLVDPADLAPGAVTAHKLVDIDLDPTTQAPGLIDGVRTTFALRYVSPADGSTIPATPSAGVQLQVVLDGVLQEAGVDYTTSAATIVFAHAPDDLMHFSGVWYAPGG